MRTVVLVPYRAGDDEVGQRRQQLWDFTRSWWERNHPEWEIFTGDSGSTPFDRGASINCAARDAGEWDVAIISDADNVMVEPVSVLLAAQFAVASDWIIYPHTHYRYLRDWESEQVLTHPEQTDLWPVVLEQTRHPSGLFAVSRTTWNRLGGFISQPGWGSEDALFYRAAQKLVGVTHLDFTCLHLSHGYEPEWKNQALIDRNWQHWNQFEQLESEELLTYLRTLGATPGEW